MRFFSVPADLPSATKQLQFSVIIAGGGFAAIYCARQLARELGPDAATQVALVADENFMVFQPMLPEVAGSALPPRHVVNPIRRLCPNITVLRARISSIDIAKRELITDAGDQDGTIRMGFEHLVIAVGGIVDLSRVPGMPEHAYLMKNVGDALRLRATVIDRFEEANLELDPESQRRLLTFVIVGGGYSGVETAGQIFDLARDMVNAYNRVQASHIRVVLVHSGSHLMPELNESLGKYTEDTLRKRGVEIIMNARVTAMTASRAVLDNGDTIPSYTVVSTVGNAPHPLVKSLCQQGVWECEKGRIRVTPTLQVEGQDRLWAAGDCAAVPMDVSDEAKKKGAAAPSQEKGGSPFAARKYCPATAQFAMREGQLLAKNLAAKLTGNGSIRPFTFTGLGELAAIGHHAAVAEIMGFRFHGFIAWWMWRTIYLMKLPGLERKIHVMLDWTLDLFFPRDIAAFQSAPTKLMREMHLETGDTLFHAGDPARSLYLIQAGKIQMLDRDGKPLRTLGQGEQLGRETLSRDKAWPYTAIAAEPSLLVAISAKVVKAINRTGNSAEEVLKSDIPTPTPAGALAEK